MGLASLAPCLGIFFEIICNSLHAALHPAVLLYYNVVAARVAPGAFTIIIFIIYLRARTYTRTCTGQSMHMRMQCTRTERGNCERTCAPRSAHVRAPINYLPGPEPAAAACYMNSARAHREIDIDVHVCKLCWNRRSERRSKQTGLINV